LEGKIVRYLRNKKVVIKDEKLFNNLLKKLSSDDARLIAVITAKLVEENKPFHIEVYESESDLEDLYFVIHYDTDVADEIIEEDIFNLNEYLRKVDKDYFLWFVCIVGEKKDKITGKRILY
jgi:hypothetical protein